MLDFKNLEQLKSKLKTQEDCLRYYESVRFEEGYFCPHCNHEKHYKLKKQFSYRCANTSCRKTFNVLTKTIFENTKIPLTFWFTALYLSATLKKGINSTALSHVLGIRQPTCWFMLHRIREGYKGKENNMLKGTVEADESYVGGKLSNNHESKIKENNRLGRGMQQTPIVSMIERNGSVKTFVSPDVSGAAIYQLITENIERGETLITDGFTSYKWVGKQYNHIAVKHDKSRITYGDKHTNNVEGYFSQFKRMIYGVYHQVSRKHLQRYCHEMDFRHNTRKLTSSLRFDQALRQSESRLKYNELVKKVS